MIEGLFKKQKNITEKSLINYLKKMNYMNTDQYKIEGYQRRKHLPRHWLHTLILHAYLVKFIPVIVK